MVQCLGAWLDHHTHIISIRMLDIQQVGFVSLFHVIFKAYKILKENTVDVLIFVLELSGVQHGTAGYPPPYQVYLPIRQNCDLFYFTQ